MGGKRHSRRPLPGLETASFLVSPHGERKKEEREGGRERSGEIGRGKRGFYGISSYKDTGYIGSGPPPHTNSFDCNHCL